ncbi:MAG: cation:proton antiporter [Deltaproteobacteria bacterium]|nr:cation:proton antiporter [Deltaproteobacteria bacterium]
MELALLKNIFIIFGLSIVVLFVCLRIKIPTIVGFLITGIVAGPHGLGFISAVAEVETMSEIGIVLLLFTIGIEFSLKDLLRIKKLVFLGGSVQIALTVLSFFFIARQVGQTVPQSVLMGCLMALSSTAIVLKLLQERAEIESPHGRTSLGILIFQDIAIVPMILITPVLAGAGGNLAGSLMLLIVKVAGILILVYASSKWLVPQILYHIARTRNREIFLLSIIILCLAVAWLTHSLGLSLALGAFLAGLIISESEYSHQALGNILPFRDLFISFFFVSIGMLLNLDFVLRNMGIIILITAGVVVLKAIIAGATASLLGYPLRTMILVGCALSQVGEFSFVLSKAGLHYGLLTPGKTYQLFLAVSVLTMMVTPFVILAAPHLVAAAVRLPLPQKLKSGVHPAFTVTDLTRTDHLIIIGFGLNGRNVARAAKTAGVPYIIIEMNPETVRHEKALGEPIFYGDATHEAVFHHAAIHNARIIVITIADAAATRNITSLARAMNPKIHIIARTRFLQEVEPLYELGADEVIPEEFETSVEIFTRVMAKYLIPRDEIERFVRDVRSDGYHMFRSISADAVSCSNLRHCLPDIEIASFRIDETSPLAGKTLGETEMRKKYGVTVLAVRRNGTTISNPDITIQFAPNDILFLLGRPEQFATITKLFYNV